MDPQIVAFLGILLGVLIRMLIPAMQSYRKAMEEGKEWHWNHKYTMSALISFVVGLATTAIGFGMFTIPEVYDLTLLISTIVYGFGLDVVITEVLEWL